MRFSVASVLVSLALCAAAAAQPTAFTYQGQLKDGGAPAGGLHDFRFRLFDAPTGGTQVGVTQCVDNILVAGGLFTATLDFGNQFATPDQRFIEIEVRRDTGLDCSNAGGFTVLAPRQVITPAPLAMHAKSAFSLDAANGSIANAVFVDNAGKVGIGTTAPTHNVHVAAHGPTLALQDLNAASQQGGYVSYRDNANVERAWVGYGTPGDPDFSIVNARPGGDIVFLPLGGGNVGIGTNSPAAALDARGEIRYGSSGQYRPAACEEPLRIIRGKVSSAGSLVLGAGYTVTHNAAGIYTVTFTTPFTGAPVVTANQEQPSGLPTGVILVNFPTTTSVRFLLFDVTGSLNDENFQFIAIGPR